MSSPFPAHSRISQGALEVKSQATTEQIPAWYMDVPNATILPPTVVRKDGDDVLALAQYLKDDLMRLLKYKQALDPIAWLNLFRLKGEYPLHKEFIIEMIADDIGMMIRDQLIVAVHVIFATPIFLKSDDRLYLDHFDNVYHAKYLTMEPEYGLARQEGPLHEIDAIPSEDIVGSTQFTIAVTWIPGLTRSRKSAVRRHRFLFDWVKFDGEEAIETIRRVMRGQINPDQAEPVEPRYGPGTAGMP
jgi:hypothetical protein